MALRKQTVHIPLAQGVDLKKNEINLEMPQLEVAHEVYFPNPGGIAKRKGWTSLGGTNGQQTRTGASDTLTNVSYSGKGTLGMGVFDDKLFALSHPENASGVINPNGNLWNWGDELGRWNNTPGANSFEPLEIDDKTVCDSPTEQYNGDAARYTTGNTTLDLVAWQEAAAIAWAIIDTTTDSVVYRSTITGVGGTPLRPRVFLCEGDNWHIWYTDDVNLKVFKIAADTFVSSGGVTLSTSTTTVLTSSAANVPYAVKKLASGQIVAAIRNAAGTGYQIVTVDKTGTAIAGPTTHGFIAGATSPIDIAVSPETTRLYVIRVNGTPAVRADLLNSSTLAAVTTDIAVDSGATEYNELTVAFTGLDQGAGVRWCRVFISGQWTITVAARATKCYRLTSGGAAAVTVTGPSGSTYWAIHENLASHAFVKGQDSVYVFMCHRPVSDAVSSGVGGTSNYIRFGSYHLWRHDGVMLCDFLSVTGGRLQVGGVEDRNHYLPQVEQLSTSLNLFRCVFTDRKVVSKQGIGSNGAYGDRTIKQFTFDFDVPLVAVQMGRTAYLSNGMTYDGQGVYEQNFVHAPHLPFSTAVSFAPTGGAAGSGLDDDKDFGYALIWEWTNANGEVDRSAVETFFTVHTPVLAGTANDNTVTLPAIGTLVATLKKSSTLASLPPSLAVFRTIANPPDGSPYYRVTSLDPGTSGTNGYVYNDPTAAVISFTDGMPDSTLITKDTLYISQGELAHFHPGVGKILSAGKNRLYSAGKEDGNQIFYSKNWEPGEVVAFSDANVVQIPEGGGDVTAVVPMDSQLVVFKKKQIYVLQGDGADDTGSTGGYTNPQLVESTVGCIDPKSIAQYPGGVLFQSHKGIMNFTGSSVQYVGGPIQDYVGDIAATVVHPTDHMVMWFLKTAATALHDEPSSIAVLVYDYLVDQWATWGSPTSVKNALVWNDTVVYMTNASGTVTVGKQSDTKQNLGGVSYTMQLVTPWIKPADVQGFGRLWRVGVIGKYQANHILRMKIAYDYVPTVVDTLSITWENDPGLGVPCQARFHPSRQLITAFKLQLLDVAAPNQTLFDSIEFASLALEIGQRTGIMRTPTTRSV